MKLFLSFTLLIAVALGLSPDASAQTVASSSGQWKPILYGGNGVSDPSLDQQTGQRESDIVGTSLIPSAYTLFEPGTVGSATDGTLYFRLRLAEDSQGAGYSGFVWVGIDGNSDGAIDIFAGINRQGSSSQTVLRNPGTGANSSPNTTSIVTTDLSPSPYTHTASNYNWAPVSAASYAGTNFDVDGGGNVDYFMSFSLPFQDLVTAIGTTGSGRPTGISINDATNLKFVIATSQQGNSINQDYNGGSIPANSTSSFVSLGAISDPTTASSSSIPEPSGLLLAGLASGVLAVCVRRR